MGKPAVNVLTNEEVESVHIASLEILDDVGVYLPNKGVLKLVSDNGAQVDFEKNLARIPSSVVEEFVRKAPAEFTLYARDPKFNMNLRPESLHFGIGGGSTRFVDMDTGKSRQASLGDLDKLVEIADMLENCSLLGELVLPVDVPPELSLQFMWMSLLKNSRKHIMMYISDSDYVKDGIQMGSVIAGSKEELARKPIISFLGCVGQPLTYERRFLDGFIEVAKHGIPILVHSGVMAGATGPVTLAGTLALSNAEILSGITIAEMVNPGTPVIYNNWSRIFDMKAGNVSIAGPEFALLRIATGQLVRRHYEIPLASGGFSVDSKAMDVQAGYEKNIALISLLAGTNLILGYKLDQGNVIDPISWVFDDELAGACLRVMKGFKVDDHTLALDVIRSVGVGPGKNFLTLKHTHDHLRDQQWLTYRVTERRPLSAWESNGAKDAKQRAKDRLNQKMKTYQPQLLPVNLQKGLEKILNDAREKLSMSQK